MTRTYLENGSEAETERGARRLEATARLDLDWIVSGGAPTQRCSAARRRPFSIFQTRPGYAPSRSCRRGWAAVLLLLAIAGAAGAQQPEPPRGDPSPPFGSPGMVSNDPQLAPVLRAVFALREIHLLHLTRAEIGAALPVLREIRQEEVAVHERAEKLLQEEKRALLALGPDDPLPPGGGYRLRDELKRFREGTDRLWKSLGEHFDVRKAAGLRRLIEPGPPPQQGADPVPPGPQPGNRGRQIARPPIRIVPAAPPALRLTVQELIDLLEQKRKAMRQ